MTAPVFLGEAETLATARPGEVVVLAGPEARHAAVVRRTGVGERVDVVDGNGLRVSGTVVATTKDSLDVRVASVRHEQPPAVRFTLVQALAKGGRDEQAVEAATELGVDRIVPWQAERSIVRWRGDRGERARQKWVDAVRSATKQSRRARMPSVAAAVDLAGLVALVQAADVAYVLHEEGMEHLASQTLPERGEVLLVVGPEGGVTAAEVTALTEAGAGVVRLGDTVLRSSSAGPAALAVLSAMSRWRGGGQASEPDRSVDLSAT